MYGGEPIHYQSGRKRVTAMAETFSRVGSTAGSTIRISGDVNWGMDQVKFEATPELYYRENSLAYEVMASGWGTRRRYFGDGFETLSLGHYGVGAGYIEDPQSPILTSSLPRFEPGDDLSTLSKELLIQTLGDVTIVYVGRAGNQHYTYAFSPVADLGIVRNPQTLSDWVLLDHSINKHMEWFTSVAGRHLQKDEVMDVPEGRTHFPDVDFEADFVTAPPLHPLAMEFKRGVPDESPPIPRTVAVVDRMLKSVEVNAKDSEISVDIDGAISFTIVALDGTLISGELATNGKLYAWHYEIDWSTQQGEILGEQDVSSLLGWLG